MLTLRRSPPFAPPELHDGTGRDWCGWARLVRLAVGAAGAAACGCCLLASVRVRGEEARQCRGRQATQERRKRQLKSAAHPAANGEPRVRAVGPPFAPPLPCRRACCAFFLSKLWSAACRVARSATRAFRRIQRARSHARSCQPAIWGHWAATGGCMRLCGACRVSSGHWRAVGGGRAMLAGRAISASM